MVNIGEYVARERDLRGLTLEQLYELTGIRPSHLSRLINNPPKSPDVETVEKFAKAFHVTASDIWRAISEDGAARESSMTQLISARIARHLEHVPREKQEKIVVALERTAQTLAEFASPNLVAR